MAVNLENNNFRNNYNLRFKDDNLEKIYLKYYHIRVAKVYKVIFLVTVFLMFSYNILDRITAPNSNPNYLLLLRSILGIICLFMFLPRLKATRKYIDVINSILFFLIGFGTEIIAVSFHPIDKVAYYGSYAGIILVFIGGCNCLLIRFIPALLTSLILLISYYILALIMKIEPLIIINVEVFLTSSCVLCLYGAYRIEKLMRINFLREENLKKETKEVEDSIVYASYIQQALLTSHEILDNCKIKNFILFKPRDIISGDFYWFKQIKNYLYFAAADCTGHGVPGAFMSVLGISLLNEIVSKRDLNPPAMVLNELRKKLKKSLKQDNPETASHDGIDIALCLFDLETKMLQFSGAFNPLFLVRNNELIEYSANHMPVGVHPKDNIDFTNKEIQLQSDDLLYIFSDGFISQFGGEKGKKFSIKQFKQLLVEINHQPQEIQKQLLEQRLIEWQQDFEQIDDILVIGITI
jgi:serine phosphatase RsbU (regulator of sigma subunit)